MLEQNLKMTQKEKKYHAKKYKMKGIIEEFKNQADEVWAKQYQLEQDRDKYKKA